jgi:hypothetical protein
MTLEAHVLAEIEADEEIADEFRDDEGELRPFEDWMYQASSLGEGENPAIPNRPYIVWNELEDTEHRAVSETSDARTRNLLWFVYDVPGDYTRIDRILYKFKRRIKQLDHFTTADGVVCSDARWLGTSGQIPSDGYASCTKWGSSEFTVSR